MTGHRSVDAKVAEGDERTTKAKRFQRNGRCFFHSTQYAVLALDFPIMSLRLFDQFADEVALGEDDRGAAGLSGSLQAQQFTALPPDEYGTSGT